MAKIHIDTSSSRDHLSNPICPEEDSDIPNQDIRALQGGEMATVVVLGVIGYIGKLFCSEARKMSGSQVVNLKSVGDD